jgi:hypothetical protein
MEAVRALGYSVTFHQRMQAALAPETSEIHPTLVGLERTLRTFATRGLAKTSRNDFCTTYATAKEWFAAARDLIIRPGSKWHSNIRSLLQTFATLGGSASF